MATAITALAVVGFVAGIIWLLTIVHKRDQKKEATRKHESEAKYPRI
jgi:cyanate permease